MMLRESITVGHITRIDVHFLHSREEDILSTQGMYHDLDQMQLDSQQELALMVQYLLLLLHTFQPFTNEMRK